MTSASASADPSRKPDDKRKTFWINVGQGVRHLLELVGFASLIYGVILAWGTYQTSRQQADDARAAQLSQRFGAATENFTAKDLAKRVSGIHELSQPAVIEPRYRASVMDMLEAFIRDESPKPEGASCKDEPAWDRGYKAPDHGHLASALSLSLEGRLRSRLAPAGPG